MSSTVKTAEFGLVSRHQYTTLSTAEYKGERLVKLRNPWGRERYNGPWSDSDSAKWTAEARYNLGKHLKKDDGSFWMPFKDFQRIF